MTQVYRATDPQDKFSGAKSKPGTKASKSAFIYD